MSYIQDKLAEFDDRFAIIVDEKIDGKVYLNRDYGDFYGQRDELKDFIKEMFTDYHNHIIEIIKELPAFTSCTDKTMGKVSDEAKVPMYGTNYLERETVLSLLQDNPASQDKE